MKKINIPIDQQVVDRRTARKLTEKLKGVGIEVESAFYYQRRRNRILNDEIKYSDKSVYTKWQKWVLLEVKRCDSGNAYKQVESIPAYTLPELLEVLPGKIIVDLDDTLTEIYYPSISKYTACYIGERGGFTLDDECFIASNTATAAAKLLIWCIDNGYVKGAI